MSGESRGRGGRRGRGQGVGREGREERRGQGVGREGRGRRGGDRVWAGRGEGGGGGDRAGKVGQARRVLMGRRG